jgi:eukaryotic-like serine/threonine-protein kinase
VPETPLDRLISSKPLPLAEVLRYGIQIADALTAAHAAGITHRDIKPANVMVTPHGQVKVLDFGLAKWPSDRAFGPGSATRLTNLSLTQPGHIPGTVAYMSPEQARGHVVDTRTDVWAFGCVLFEMLTGTPAFARENVSDTIAAILEREPDWDRLPGATSERIRRLLRQCLQKDADRRLQDIAAARQEIEKALAHKRSTPQLAIAAAVLAILTVVVWLIRGREAPDAMLHAIPLTSFLGSQDWPSFSPDGDQVAFSWDGDTQDNFDIYVKRIGSGPPLRLTHDAAIETHPAWSPDGNTIALLRVSKPGRCAVVLIPPLGGPERVVTEVAQGPDRASLAWSPDSKWLVVFDEPEQKPAGLWLLSVETGERRQLTNVPVGVFDEAAAIAPDGRTLGFTRTVAPNSADLYVLALDQDLRPRGEPRRLTYDNEVVWGLAWARDGREIVFSAGSPGSLKLWRVASAPDSRPTRLFDQGEVLNVAIALRSSRLVFVRSRREMDIYRAELSSSGTEARGSMPLIASSRLDRYPSYSPDGKKIAFVSLRSGNWQLWASDSDGTNPVQMTSFDRGEVAFPAWSPDGRQIGFIGHVEGTYQAYVVDAAGGKPRKLEALGTDVGGWKWSHEGSIFFPSSSRTASYDLWKIPPGGSVAERLTRHGAGRPTESRDGKLIYYPRSGGVWSLPLNGGNEREVFRSNLYAGAVDASRAGIYFIANSSVAKDGDLMFFRFPGGPITKIDGVRAHFGISLSPDDHWLAYTKMTATGSDLMLVENFR